MDAFVLVFFCLGIFIHFIIALALASTIFFRIIQLHSRSQEALSVVRQAGGGAVAPTSLLRLAQRWERRWPSDRQRSAGACLVVANVREILLDALSARMGPDAAAPTQPFFQVTILLLVAK
jgi:hypothetical protein